MFLHEFRTMGSTIAVTWRSAVWFRKRFQEKNLSADYLAEISQFERDAEKLLREIQNYGDSFQKQADEGAINIEAVEDVFNKCASQSIDYLRELIALIEPIIDAFSLTDDEALQDILGRLKTLHSDLVQEPPRIWW